MGNGLLAFAAGLGSGYLGAQQRNKEQERLDRLDAQAAELHGRKISELDRLNSERVALGNIGKPITVNPQGATLGLADGTQTVYDDAGVANSDFRQLRSADQATGNETLARAPLVVPGQSLADGTMPQAPQQAITVNGKTFGSLADAQGAADTANKGIPERQAAYFDSIGQPDKAAAMRTSSLQLDEKQTAAARERANRVIMDQVRANGGDVAKTVAQVLTKTSAAGLEGTNVEAVTDPASKTVKMVATKPDGSKQVLREYPIGTYGQAWMLSEMSQASIKDVQTFLSEVDKHQSGLAKTDAEIAHLGAQTGKENALADSLKPGGAKSGTDKPFKMNEDDKLLFQSVNSSVHEADKGVADAMGKLMPGDDPTKAPGVVYAQKRLQQAKLNQLKTHVNLGVITPEQLANDVMGVAKTPAEVMTSLNQLVAALGPEVSDKVGRLVMASDAWAKMTPQKPAHAPKPAAAPAKPSLATPAEPAKPPPEKPKATVQSLDARADTLYQSGKATGERIDNDPELKALKADAVRLLQANKGKESRAKMAEYNTLKQQKYGV